VSESERELREVKESLRDTKPIGPLVATCKTLGPGAGGGHLPGRCVGEDAAVHRGADRREGRGKSAALGVAIAGAVGLGYANIFVTAPTPRTCGLSSSLCSRGLMPWSSRSTWTTRSWRVQILPSTEAVVRVNVFAARHRQTIQFVLPQHAERRAAGGAPGYRRGRSHPLPMVRALLGP